jgi:subtilisin family serine protease
MKKRNVICLLLIMLVLFLPIFVDAKVEKISKAIMNAEENQKIRVVVHLKDDSSQKTTNSMSLSEQIIPEDKIKYKNKNNLFASLNKQEIEQLAKSENVESVSEERKYQITLAESVPLINATNSWNLQSSGINLTGIGQTICIIDTGVNYSHPDLGGGCWGNNNNTSSCKIIGGWDYCANDDALCTGTDSNPMDVNGHGTHVAGIAAANGAIKGAAPLSKIIMIKTANATGTFWDSDIKKAIDWCVSNSTKFNISVISMSLGGYLYDNYCDWDDPSNVVSSINAAIAKNISVIAASGNDANSTNIASPACIQNVTPIGDTYDANVGEISWGIPWLCTDSTTTLDKIVCHRLDKPFLITNHGFIIKH